MNHRVQKAFLFLCMAVVGLMVSGVMYAADPEPLKLPIVTKPLELTYWVPLDGNAGIAIPDYSHMTAYQEFERKTGIEIRFLHPPIGQETEQFNLMVASGDYPDMIESNWLGYPGGPEKAIRDGVIIPLNEYIDKYAPNLKRILEERPDIRKQVVTDNGTIYTFPFIRKDPEILVWLGFQVRQDWLEKLNLPLPKTLDDWYVTLKAFKEQDPNGNGEADEIPWSTNQAWAQDFKRFYNSWGKDYGFYRIDDTIHFGPAEPEYKEYLATMNKWYSEGLIDPDYASMDQSQFDAKMTSNLVGACFGTAGSTLRRVSDLVGDKIPGFDLVGVEHPVGPAGAFNMHAEAARMFSGLGASVTSQNRNIKETIKWLDYPYSEEGNLIMNFGREGLSYEMIDGYPTFTDEVLNHPTLSMGQAISSHARSSFNGPFVQDARYFEQYMADPPMLMEAINRWAVATRERCMPPITPTPQESRKFASLMSDIQTYVDEMHDRFVMGYESLDNFDRYIQTLKNMGIDEAIAIQQAALDRYNER